MLSILNKTIQLDINNYMDLKYMEKKSIRYIIISYK